ncbi:hypothetical protein electrica_05481 (plasmid) [Klebsiella electrica]|nr:hypothetical protein electrica_05481 [Klebsiella electrica]
MKEEQKQCDSQPAQSQEASPCASRVTFCMEKKAITAEQYRDWQLLAASLRRNIKKEV